MVKDSYKDKTLYAKKSNSLGINIYEHNSKKFYPITNYSKILDISHPEAFNHLIIFDSEKAAKKQKLFNQIKNNYLKLSS